MLFSYNGWLAGYQTVYDTAKSKVTQNNFAVGYSKDDITLHTAVYVTVPLLPLFGYHCLVPAPEL